MGEDCRKGNVGERHEREKGRKEEWEKGLSGPVGEGFQWDERRLWEKGAEKEMWEKGLSGRKAEKK